MFSALVIFFGIRYLINFQIKARVSQREPERARESRRASQRQPERARESQREPDSEPERARESQSEPESDIETMSRRC